MHACLEECVVESCWGTAFVVATCDCRGTKLDGRKWQWMPSQTTAHCINFASRPATRLQRKNKPKDIKGNDYSLSLLPTELRPDDRGIRPPRIELGTYRSTAPDEPGRVSRSLMTFPVLTPIYIRSTNLPAAPRGHLVGWDTCLSAISNKQRARHSFIQRNLGVSLPMSGILESGTPTTM